MPAQVKMGNRQWKIVNGSWLPDMDLNHDKQIQSLLCYRYTIGQTSDFKVKTWARESRLLNLSVPSKIRNPNLDSQNQTNESETAKYAKHSKTRRGRQRFAYSAYFAVKRLKPF